MTTQQPDPPPDTVIGGHRGQGRAPLLLTLRLAEPAQSLFQTLRNRHFPADRNIVPAHISLFHALPGPALGQIRRRLRQTVPAQPPVWVEALFPLGRGVAFRLHSPALQALRAALAADWAAWLTPQDAQGYRPHVTIQNKVEPSVARDTLARLQTGFVPFATHGVALELWRYLDGPWEALDSIGLPPPDSAAG